jgi:hypothetical protein
MPCGAREEEEEEEEENSKNESDHPFCAMPRARRK